MLDLNIEFSKATMYDFNRAMNRFANESKKTPKQVITWGGIKLLGSLGASTKISPKTRKIVLPKNKQQKNIRRADGTRLFYAVGYNYNGGRRYIPIWAVDKRQARFDRAAVIRNRKLAKRSWGWAKHDLFNKVWNDSGNRGIIKRNVLTRRYVFNDAYGVRIKNRINYIQDSFKIGGRQSVNTALLRTVKGMETQIEKKLFKKASL